MIAVHKDAAKPSRAHDRISSKVFRFCRPRDESRRLCEVMWDQTRCFSMLDWLQFSSLVQWFTKNEVRFSSTWDTLWSLWIVRQAREGLFPKIQRRFTGAFAFKVYVRLTPTQDKSWYLAISPLRISAEFSIALHQKLSKILCWTRNEHQQSD